MMGIETIKAMAREAAEAAAEEGKTPFRYWNETEIDEYRGFPFPFLGDYVPDGWEMVEDSSGFGQDDEAALSVRQMVKLVKANLADGWGKAGQFQVYVGQYRKTS